MKYLFFNIPAHGHVNATLPVVKELVQRGHEVIYYCNDEFAEKIRDTGATYRAYPIEVAPSHVLSSIADNLANVSVLLLQKSIELAPFAIEEVETEKPDVILYDEIVFWARIAAQVTGVKSIVTFPTVVLEGAKGVMGWRNILHILRTSLSKVPALLRARGQLAKIYGKEVVASPLFPSVGDINIAFYPEQFQPETDFVDQRFHFVGASINEDTRGADEWQAIETKRPVVYISLGTVNNMNTDFYYRVFEAFADYPAEFILSIGRHTSIERLGQIPQNFAVYNYVPQLDVLQQADVFITHGGMNSVQEGLYYGVPEIVVPQQLEQLANGMIVDKLGVGLLIGATPPYGHVKSADLRNALDTLLNEKSYWEKAQIYSHQSQDVGGYKRAADIIEQAVKKPRYGF